MIELKKDFCEELKNACETVYRLSEKIKINGVKADTEYIWSNGKDKQSWIVETDRHELPYRYYHAQCLNLHTEIRKSKKGYAIHCINFMANERTLKKWEEEIKDVKLKEYGERRNQQIITEFLEYAIDIYEDIVIDMIEWIKAKKENLLIW